MPWVESKLLAQARAGIARRLLQPQHRRTRLMTSAAAAATYHLIPEVLQGPESSGGILKLNFRKGVRDMIMPVR